MPGDPPMCCAPSSRRPRPAQSGGWGTMTAERDRSAQASRPRSGAWFAAEARAGMIYRSWLRAEGFTPDVFDGRPVIGIANSWSELTPCNVHLRAVADAVKRGVWQAGGFPLEFPTMSLGESLMRPTAMLFRNLMALEGEGLGRANPLAGVGVVGGCGQAAP